MKKKNKRNTLLWQISGEKSKGTSYLFGTIHVKDSRAFFNNKSLQKAIRKCDTYVGEFNLKDTDPSLLNQYMLLPEGTTITNSISIKQAISLDKLLQKNVGVGLAQLNHHKPMMLVNLLTEANFQADMSEPLDNHLYNYAKVQGKRMDGLETFTEQLNVLTDISLKDQFKSLISILKKYKNFRKQIKKMTRYYLAMDIQRLYKSAKRSSKGMRKILIYKRNILMAKRMGKLMKTETAFFAIGAGHLAGEKGVLRLLKKQGFKIRPIKFS